MENYDVIYVDDDTLVVRAFARLFGRYCNIKSYIKPKQALEDLRTNTTYAKAVISDMEMPIMNGIILLSEIQRIHPEIKRGLISGRMREISPQIQEGLVHATFEKPFDNEIIKKTLDDWLGANSR